MWKGERGRGGRNYTEIGLKERGAGREREDWKEIVAGGERETVARDRGG